METATRMKIRFACLVAGGNICLLALFIPEDLRLPAACVGLMFTTVGGAIE